MKHKERCRFQMMLQNTAGEKVCFMWFVIILNAILAYIVYQDCKAKTGNEDSALGWAVGTFFVGIVLFIVYFLVSSSLPKKQILCPKCQRENLATGQGKSISAKISCPTVGCVCIM